jgi:hypothetical protein
MHLRLVVVSCFFFMVFRTLLMFPAAALCEKNWLCPFCVGGAIQGLVYAVSVLGSLVHISSLLGASQWFCVGVSWGTSVGGRNILTGLGLGLGSWD